MTRDQYDALVAYIDARVDEAIAMRSGYSHEAARAHRAEREQEPESSGIIEEPMT